MFHKLARSKTVLDLIGIGTALVFVFGVTSPILLWALLQNNLDWPLKFGLCAATVFVWWKLVSGLQAFHDHLEKINIQQHLRLVFTSPNYRWMKSYWTQAERISPAEREMRHNRRALLHLVVKDAEFKAT